MGTECGPFFIAGNWYYAVRYLYGKHHPEKAGQQWRQTHWSPALREGFGGYDPSERWAKSGGSAWYGVGKEIFKRKEAEKEQLRSRIAELEGQLEEAKIAFDIRNEEAWEEREAKEKAESELSALRLWASEPPDARKHRLRVCRLPYLPQYRRPGGRRRHFRRIGESTDG